MLRHALIAAVCNETKQTLVLPCFQKIRDRTDVVMNLDFAKDIADKLIVIDTDGAKDINMVILHQKAISRIWPISEISETESNKTALSKALIALLKGVGFEDLVSSGHCVRIGMCQNDHSERRCRQVYFSISECSRCA